MNEKQDVKKFEGKFPVTVSCSSVSFTAYTHDIEKSSLSSLVFAFPVPQQGFAALWGPSPTPKTADIVELACF